jgi:polysaccharide chain length determinant protein (PEP-CTERM system associated)
MPEQRTSNLDRLNSLHEQYQGVQDSIQDLERTKVMVQEQINLRRRLVGAMGTASQTDSNQANQPLTPWQRLQQLRNHLASLKVKYTEKHPEIRRTKQLISKLETELNGTQPPSGSRSGSRAVRIQDPEIGQLQIQLKEVSLNLQKLRADQKNIRSDIPKYEQWITDTPVREAEWNALTRDYNELRRNYDYLVSQNLQASSVEHLEKKQKGSKFKIVDRARFPEKPYAPRFLRIMLLAILAGLGCGVGLILAMDFIDTSFKDVSEVESYLGLPVVSSIPYLKEYHEVGEERKRTVFWGAMLFFYLIVLLACLVYFRQKGLIVF